MFTRFVSMKLKSNVTPEFNRVIENEILPLLRKQPGFRDEITFVAPERSEAVAISFWETKENCENYNRTGYPEVLKIVSKFVEGAYQLDSTQACR